jgi:hypothetical protein
MTVKPLKVGYYLQAFICLLPPLSQWARFAMQGHSALESARIALASPAALGLRHYIHDAQDIRHALN